MKLAFDDLSGHAKNRTRRVAPGGMVLHVLNRAVDRDEMFENDEDYLAFLCVMRDTLEKRPMRVLAFCAMVK